MHPKKTKVSTRKSKKETKRAQFSELVNITTHLKAIDPSTTLEYGPWHNAQGFHNTTGGSASCPQLGDMHKSTSEHTPRLRKPVALGNSSCSSRSSPSVNKSFTKIRGSSQRTKLSDVTEFAESLYPDMNLSWKSKSVSTALAKQKPKSDDRRTWYPKKTASVLHSKQQVANGSRKRKVGRPTKAMVKEREALSWKNSKMDPNSEEDDSIDGDYNYRNYVLRFVFYQIGPRASHKLWTLSEDDLPRSWWLCDAGKPTGNSDFPFQLQFSGHIKNVAKMDRLLKQFLLIKQNSDELLHFVVMENFDPQSCKLQKM